MRPRVLAVDRLALLEQLAEAGADVQASDVRGYTALFYAARFNKGKAVAALLKRGADVGAVLAKKPLSSFKPAIAAQVSDQTRGRRGYQVHAVHTWASVLDCAYS